MFGFVDQGAADAAMRGDAKIVADYLDDNPNQLDNRTIFQSTLLHIAARNGRLQVAVELLRRGIDVNALDYGGMRRTALHWACQGGHVRMVELLMEFGADCKIWCSHDILLEQLQVQGKGWSKLVQGRKCGQLIRSDEAIDKSPAQMCVNNSVRLALERPLWTPDINYMFPHRFKEMVQIMLFSLDCRKDLPAAQPCSSSRQREVLPAGADSSCPAAPARCPAATSEQPAVSLGHKAASQAPQSLLRHQGQACQSDTAPSQSRDLPAQQAGFRQERGGGCEAQQPAPSLSWDSCQQIIALAAYPISAWL